jgi:copper chaperone CopZ
MEVVEISEPYDKLHVFNAIEHIYGVKFVETNPEKRRDIADKYKLIKYDNYINIDQLVKLIQDRPEMITSADPNIIRKIKLCIMYRGIVRLYDCFEGYYNSDKGFNHPNWIVQTALQIFKTIQKINTLNSCSICRFSDMHCGKMPKTGPIYYENNQLLRIIINTSKIHLMNFIKAYGPLSLLDTAAWYIMNNMQKEYEEKKNLLPEDVIELIEPFQ